MTDRSLQYIKKYEPFPYGISADAMSYAYSKRAEVAMRSEGQKPVNLSAMVIDSRPAIELKTWATEEQDRARAAEARAFKLEPPTDNNTYPGDPSDSLSPSAQPQDARALQLCTYSYEMAIRLYADARVEYERHLASPEYMNRFQLYESHLDDIDLQGALCRADLDYLQARDGARPDTRDLLRSSVKIYGDVILSAQRIVLKILRRRRHLARDDAAWHQ